MTRPDPIAAAKRRAEIVRYFAEHGGTATAQHFGIHRSRVYVIVNKMLKAKPYKRNNSSC